MARKAATARPGRGILTRVNAEGLKALRQLALDRDTTLQALAIEGFNLILKKHGRRAVVREPYATKGKSLD
jgi:Antitoxin-like ribbon-helix-helix